AGCRCPLPIPAVRHGPRRPQLRRPAAALRRAAVRPGTEPANRLIPLACHVPGPSGNYWTWRRERPATGVVLGTARVACHVSLRDPRVEHEREDAYRAAV